MIAKSYLFITKSNFRDPVFIDTMAILQVWWEGQGLRQEGSVCRTGYCVTWFPSVPRMLVSFAVRWE